MRFEGFLASNLNGLRAVECRHADVSAYDRDGQPSLADWVEVFRASIPSFQQRAEQDSTFEAGIAKVCQSHMTPMKADQFQGPLQLSANMGPLPQRHL